MFNDSPGEVVGFNHTETQKMNMKSEIACQYTGMFTKDQLCDTIDVKTTATQTNEIEHVDIKHVDLVALNNFLERSFTLLKTECKDWPNMKDYF